MKFKKPIPGILVLLSVMLLLSGCMDEPEAVLASGVWTFKSLDSDSELASVQSSVFLKQAFFEGARLEFRPLGEYLIKFPLMTLPTNGTWSLEGKDQLILEADNSPATTSSILKLIKKELTYIETITGPDMEDYSITTTWIRE